MRRIGVLLLAVLAGCGDFDATVAPEAWAALTATAGGVPTATSAPTASAVPSTNSPVAAVTDTPVSDTPTPTATEKPAPPPTRTLAQDLAIINDTPGDPDFIRRVNELLAELDAGFPENQREIGDLTAQSHAVLIDEGKPMSIIAIMEEMKKLIGTAPGLTYKDAIIGWMVLMTS